MNDWRGEALNHAHSESPKESCGLVIMRNGREIYVPCRNISTIENTFILDPEDYANAEDRGEIVRVVHSHCFSSPEPSEADKVACESSGLPWSIVSVPGEKWHDFQPSGYKAPLIGRTWAHGTLDCYSLIRDYYLEKLGIEIPDFEREHEWWLKGGNLYLENFQKAGFYEVPAESMELHDVILIQISSPVINHGAVYVGDDRILHHLFRRLSGRDTYGGYYKKHTVKVIRHKLCE